MDYDLCACKSDRISISLIGRAKALRNIEEYETKYIFKSSYRKTVIENEPEVLHLFVQIINEITSCMSEDELRGCMSSLIVRHPYFKLFFDYGFGHNHMWVKASGSLERLILVEF